MNKSKSNNFTAIAYLSIAGILLARFYALNSSEYVLVKKYLTSQVIKNETYGINPHYILVGFKISSSVEASSRFNFLIINNFNFDVITIELDKKLKPWKMIIS